MQFAATATDADGDALTYTWDLDGNGTFETTGATAAATYNAAGTYNVVVKVTDARGGSATKTVTVTVTQSASTDVPVVDRRQRAQRAGADVRHPAHASAPSCRAWRPTTRPRSRGP